MRADADGNDRGRDDGKRARFFRVADRLGSVEPGKLADLILVDGEPLVDISAMRRVKRVMLNGRWVRAF